MILVTVGTQLPFDRLISVVDEWAGCHPEVRVVAQVGAGARPTRHLEAMPTCSAAEMDELIRAADTIVAHAGMGSIISALCNAKPVIILPRQAKLGEHRSDHQFATAKRLAGRPGVYVAWSAPQVAVWLDGRKDLSAGPRLEPQAHGELIDRLAAYIAGRDVH